MIGGPPAYFKHPILVNRKSAGIAVAPMGRPHGPFPAIVPAWPFHAASTIVAGPGIAMPNTDLPIVCEELWDHWTLITVPSMDAVKTMFQSDEWQKANGDRLEALERHLTVASKPVKIPV